MLLVLDPLDGTKLQTSELPEGRSPWVIRDLGDIDGDGVDDVVLSIIDYFVLVFSGANGRELRRHSYVGA